MPLLVTSAPLFNILLKRWHISLYLKCVATLPCEMLISTAVWTNITLVCPVFVTCRLSTEESLNIDRMQKPSWRLVFLSCCRFVQSLFRGFWGVATVNIVNERNDADTTERIFVRSCFERVLHANLLDDFYPRDAEMNHGTGSELLTRPEGRWRADPTWPGQWTFLQSLTQRLSGNYKDATWLYV